jgi:hypothetical protein
VLKKLSEESLAALERKRRRLSRVHRQFVAASILDTPTQRDSEDLNSVDDSHDCDLEMLDAASGEDPHEPSEETTQKGSSPEIAQTETSEKVAPDIIDELSFENLFDFLPTPTEGKNSTIVTFNNIFKTVEQPTPSLFPREVPLYEAASITVLEACR